MADNPVTDRLRSLTDQQLEYVALESDRQRDKAVAEDNKVKADVFASVAERASAVVSERLELSAINQVLAELKRLRELADRASYHV